MRLKLATKMVLGFGSCVAIAASLGLVGWNGMQKVAQNVEMEGLGTDCLNQLNTCGMVRRDFALQGFEADANGKTAVDRFAGVYAEITDTIHELESAPALGTQEKELAGQMLHLSDDYKQAFDEQVDSRKMKDAAFKTWGQVGWNITGEVDKVIQEVIAPALDNAQKSKDIEQLTWWSKVDEKLSKNFVQEFLLLRVYAVYLIATNKDAQWEGYQKQLEALNKGLAEWETLVQDNAQLVEVGRRLQNYVDEYTQAGKQYYQGILDQRSSESEMGRLAGDFLTRTQELKGLLEKEMNSVTARTSSLMWIMSLAAIIVGSLLAFFITRSIVKPVNVIISGLTEGANQVSEAAGQVSSTSQQLAEGASEQASSLEETSSSLEEMAAMTRNNASSAKEANELAGQARQAANAGDQTMQQLNGAMSAITESSEKISRIIKVIEEIAFQTNLLALNAAVEAARAGEHGKGFAVVADEVRSLAQRAATAAGETTTLIEDSVNRVHEGSQVASEVGKVLGEIVNDVAKVTDLIDHIAKASDEQAQGVEQVNVAVSQMDRVVQQNAAGTEESASAAEELAAQAESLNNIVDDLAGLVNGNSARTGQSATGSKTAPRTRQTRKTAVKTPQRKTIKSQPSIHQAPHQEDEVDFSQMNDESISSF